MFLKTVLIFITFTIVIKQRGGQCCLIEYTEFIPRIDDPHTTCELVILYHIREISKNYEGEIRNTLEEMSSYYLKNIFLFGHNLDTIASKFSFYRELKAWISDIDSTDKKKNVMTLIDIIINSSPSTADNSYPDNDLKECKNTINSICKQKNNLENVLDSIILANERNHNNSFFRHSKILLLSPNEEFEKFNSLLYKEKNIFIIDLFKQLIVNVHDIMISIFKNVNNPSLQLNVTGIEWNSHIELIRNVYKCLCDYTIRVTHSVIHIQVWKRLILGDENKSLKAIKDILKHYKRFINTIQNKKKYRSEELNMEQDRSDIDDLPCNVKSLVPQNSGKRVITINTRTQDRVKKCRKERKAYIDRKGKTHKDLLTMIDKNENYEIKISLFRYYLIMGRRSEYNEHRQIINSYNDLKIILEIFLWLKYLTKHIKYLHDDLTKDPQMEEYYQYVFQIMKPYLMDSEFHVDQMTIRDFIVFE